MVFQNMIFRIEILRPHRYNSSSSNIWGGTMKEYIEKLCTYAHNTEANKVNVESILEFLYETYDEHAGMDNEQIKKDFRELYLAMNGKSLREIDQVIYPVCSLCRGHAKAGFIEGIKVGIRLEQELFDYRDNPG